METGTSPNCPSCGSPATGRYCTHCGERISTDKSELQLSRFLKDAFEEVSNLDSKLLKTLRYLLTRPGFLTREALVGRKLPYLKPFRLYILLVVLHFVIFSFFHSGDLFTLERFPVFRWVPGVQEVVTFYQSKSELAPDQFVAAVDQKIKDNLNILFYFIVFLLAAVVKVIYRQSGRYYVEHLYYLLHLLSFGMVRNILLLPFLMYGYMWVALFFSVTTQLWYTYVSLKTVYGEPPGRTLVKVFLVMMAFVVVLIPCVFLSTFIGLLQLSYF